MPRALAADSHDFAGDDPRPDSHGARLGSGQRAVCTAGARHYRWTHGVGDRDRISGSSSVSSGSPPRRDETYGAGELRNGMNMMQMKFWLRGLCLGLLAPQILCAQVPAPSPADAAAMHLTLHQAEELALKNNPQISVSKLLALAQGQVVREVRSVELPQVTADLTAVDARDGTRLTAGGLNNPILYERAAGGVSVGQLITDFGRTHNLVASAQLQEKAQQSSQTATANDIILAVDQAFYHALSAQALVKVAQGTL